MFASPHACSKKRNKPSSGQWVLFVAPCQQRHQHRLPCQGAPRQPGHKPRRIKRVKLTHARAQGGEKLQRAQARTSLHARNQKPSLGNMSQARNDPPVGTKPALAGKKHGFGCVSKWCKVLSLHMTGQRNANGFQLCAPGFMKCWRSKPRANFVNVPKRVAFPSMWPGSFLLVIEGARSAGAIACLALWATCLLQHEVNSCIRLSSVRLEAAPLPDVVHSFVQPCLHQQSRRHTCRWQCKHCVLRHACTHCPGYSDQYPRCRAMQPSAWSGGQGFLGFGLCQMRMCV